MKLPEPGQSAKGTIQGAAGAIECILAAPSAAPRGIAVVCHPHPLYGGALTNKVVYTLDAAVRSAGLMSLRFNFRGVGKSEGTHDNARGETEDCIVLAEWLQLQLPGQPLLLAGFSFGGFVSLQAASRLAPAAVVTVAPPLKGYIEGAGQPARPRCPWLTIHSRDDDVVGFEETRAAARIYEPPPEWIEVDGAGHFFHGRLGDIRTGTEAFLDKHWDAHGS